MPAKSIAGTAAPMQSLRSTARLSDAAIDNDNNDNYCEFIVVDLCVVYTSFAAKICNISALICWVRVDFGYELVWVRVGIGLTWVRDGIGTS